MYNVSSLNSPFDLGSLSHGAYIAGAFAALVENLPQEQTYYDVIVGNTFLFIHNFLLKVFLLEQSTP